MLCSLNALYLWVVDLLTLSGVGIDADLAAHDQPLAWAVALAHIGFMKLEPEAANRPRGVADDDLIKPFTTTGAATARDQNRAFEGLLRSDLQLLNVLQ